MKMLIDKLKLKLLLEQKRECINKSIDGVDVVIAALIYIVSLLCCDFRPVLGCNPVVIATLAWVLAAVIFIYGIAKIRSSYAHKYNHEILYRDIENLDEVLHKFSIVAIKDDFNKFANRFLLYYDDAWKCWFFFSFHTVESQNDVNIVQRLSNKLKIDCSVVSVKYIIDRIQPKYSERDEVNKVYQHSLYQGVISKFPDCMQKNEFEIEGIKYRWFTVEEMESDVEIMNKNKDVVSFVKEKIC